MRIEFSPGLNLGGLNVKAPIKIKLEFCTIGVQLMLKVWDQNKVCRLAQHGEMVQNRFISFTTGGPVVPPGDSPLGFRRWYEHDTMCIRFGDNLLEKSLKNKHLSNSNRCFFLLNSSSMIFIPHRMSYPK